MESYCWSEQASHVQLKENYTSTVHASIVRIILKTMVVIVFLSFCREDFRDLEGLKPSEDVINARLTTPAVATMLNTDNIAFTR